MRPGVPLSSSRDSRPSTCGQNGLLRAARVREVMMYSPGLLDSTSVTSLRRACIFRNEFDVGQFRSPTKAGSYMNSLRPRGISLEEGSLFPEALVAVPPRQDCGRQYIPQKPRLTGSMISSLVVVRWESSATPG